MIERESIGVSVSRPGILPGCPSRSVIAAIRPVEALEESWGVRLSGAFGM
nr:hypothetical protein JVH1_8424 [Rhodococcus sp. JVH1]